MLFVLIAFIAAQRLLELRLAQRNLKWALARGGQEAAPGHYPLLVAMHSAWLVALLFEGLARGSKLGWLWWLWLGVFVLAQLGRYWVLSTLGPYWNTRIVIVPGGQRVKSGPYRFMSHPNYLVVALELLSAPLIFGAWVTALIFSLLNAALLLGLRIPAENKALGAYNAGNEKLAAKD